MEYCVENSWIRYKKSLTNLTIKIKNSCLLKYTLKESEEGSYTTKNILIIVFHEKYIKKKYIWRTSINQWKDYKHKNRKKIDRRHKHACHLRPIKKSRW